METDLFHRIIIAFPFGVGAVVFFTISVKRLGRFFIMDYRGNSKARFKDNLVGNVFQGLGLGCLVSAFFAYQEGTFTWSLLPFALFFSGLAIPIGVLGAYWSSYQTNKLWGGFMPIAREMYGFAQPEVTKQHNIDPSKIKLPRRTMVTALLVALLVFFGMFFLLSMMGWNGSILSGIVFRLFVSGLLAFGIFMTIGSVSLSRRIQKMRDGEPLNDDDDF